MFNSIPRDGAEARKANTRPDIEQRNQKESTTPSSPNALPSIGLPKGGGAIRGIGEKFSTNLSSGTASLSIPIFTTPGRGDFHPQLSLAYDSGGGNGAFGIGWHLSVPSISRKTEKGLPRYQDANDSDTFILSGAEDLVPSLVLSASGIEWLRERRETTDYIIEPFRPRIEALFARIERWTEKQTGDVHWRSVSKDNIASIYGRSATCRIVDPDDTLRVFTWLLEESYDDKGNVIVYEYKRENNDRVDHGAPQEKHRLAAQTGCAQQYLKRISYGNQTPFQRADWHFQVVFDYGEHDLNTPTLAEGAEWPTRADAFSVYRAGFEIRTRRLCRRALMFHEFTELGQDPCLVRSTDFTYDEGPVTTYLTAATQTGYIKRADGSGRYERASFPAVEFSYAERQINEEVRPVPTESLANLPAGVDGAGYQWIDLDGEGIAGILTEQSDAWFYKRNLGGARFASAEMLASKASLSDLRGGQQQLMDLAGDGHTCLVQFNGSLPGYYEREDDGGWRTFMPFVSVPNIAWNNPNLRFLDIDGDGRSDILITEDDVFIWFPSRAQEGFGPPEVKRKSAEEESGPALVFADGTQSIYLADISGDGLSDIVRIKNGEVCYWPNLGYGCFGAKVTMDNAPLFDHPDQFEQNRIRLIDVDGSGTTDIIYLGRDSAQVWFNQAGNSWSAPHPLASFPTVDNQAAVTAIDLLGNGTACLVWSSALARDAQQPLRYIDLMGGRKPHLLVSVKNNMGSETRLQYASSTKFYLQDLAAGTPWVTKLPFPFM